jgi:hypothetical protein
MDVSLTSLAAEVLADAGAIATEIGGGRTEAEIQALAALLSVLALRRDLSAPALTLLDPTNGAQINNN